MGGGPEERGGTPDERSRRETEAYPGRPARGRPGGTDRVPPRPRRGGVLRGGMGPGVHRRDQPPDRRHRGREDAVDSPRRGDAAAEGEVRVEAVGYTPEAQAETTAAVA